MADFADVVVLGATELVDGVPVVQARVALSALETDSEDFGRVDVMQGLGLTSAPWPADASGHAEAVVLRKVGGHEAVCVGARDTRTARIVGNLKPGDTVLHSTGPGQSAQLQLKESTRQAVLVTKGSDGKQVLVSLDGTADKVTIAAFGHVFEMSVANGICLIDSTGKGGLIIKDGIVSLFGVVVLGGRTPTVPVISGTSPPGVPTPGVFAGV